MGRKQKYPIQLSETQQRELERIVNTGTQGARVRRRAQALLWSAAGISDSTIARLQGVTPLTVAATRQRWVAAKSLSDKARPGRPVVLDGKQEALLVALACSAAPDGREQWTMSLLSERLVELKVVDEAISDETVRLRLKKRTQTVAEAPMVYSESE